MANSKYLSALFALLSAGLGGCASAISNSDLQWEPTVLSRQGCPDLSGEYQDKGSLSRVLFAGLGGDKPLHEPSLVERKVLRTPAVSGSTSSEMYSAVRAFNDGSRLSIDHKADSLKAMLMDSRGEVYEQITVKLDTPMTGCREDALVLRWKSVKRRAEWGGGDVTWGEREFRKLGDGSLTVTHREWQRALGVMSGGITGDLKTAPATMNRYPRVR